MLDHSDNEDVDLSPLVDRLEKDVKGALTTLLVLIIIRNEKQTWGYQIKQKLRQITNWDSDIKDSSLYTILRKLEKNYKFVHSKLKNRRRYYVLNDLGQRETAKGVKYWVDLMKKSIEALSASKAFDSPIPIMIREDMK